MIEAPERLAHPVDPRTMHRARVRAVASAIASDVDPIRKFEAGREVPLRRSARRRRTGTAPSAPAPRGRDRRLLLAAFILVAEVVTLAVLLTGPLFRVHGLTVTGTRLLTTEQVTAAARVGRGSVFSLNAGAVSARVSRLPWVQSANVSVALSGRVTIAVTERAPMIRVVRAGREYAVASDGAQLWLSSAQEEALSNVPLLIDLRPAALRTPMSASLADTLGRAALELPRLLGVRVVAYEWGAQAQLSLWTSAGWQAVLGDLSVPGALSAVPAQLGALSALRSDLDFSNPAHPHVGRPFGYVNLADPAAPAVGGRPGIPGTVSAALTSTSA